MKNLYILSFLILLPILGFSQNCKYSKNEIDEFTGSKIIITTPEFIVMDVTDSAIAVSGARTNDQKAIGFGFYLSDFFII